MSNLTEGLVMDAVAEMSLETELATVTDNSSDCWATKQQIMQYLSVSEWQECEAWLDRLEERGLVAPMDDGQAWTPTSNGWWLWQTRNDGQENPTEMNGRAT